MQIMGVKGTFTQWMIIVCFGIAMIASTTFIWAIASWKWAVGWISIQAFILAWAFCQVEKEQSK